MAALQRAWFNCDMRKTHARRYLIEIREPNGSVLFSTAAYWDEKDKRVAIAQIGRLAGLPEVNFYTEPSLEPESGKREQRPAGERVNRTRT
jgi:uncharacterized protein involved in propanediol utilization